MPLSRVLRNLFLFFNLAFVSVTYATHYRAGEISYRQLADKLYEITVTTYTDPSQGANANTTQVTVFWGDNSSEVVLRRKQEFTSNSLISKNTYIATHLYGANGDYHISITEQNRVGEIVNMPNSANYAFFVECFVRIKSSNGYNNSPVLTTPPVDEGCYNKLFVHNPGAYDSDGDSLYFMFVTPKSAVNNPIGVYSDPDASNSFTINSRTGQIRWDAPLFRPKTSIYNIAIQINEYRNGRLVGYMVRDMQIWIYNCVNSPPVIDPMVSRCVEAGKSIEFPVSAQDVDVGQIVSLQGYGGAFAVSNAAQLVPPSPISNPVFATFKWNTVCDNIRYPSYLTLIKATDNYTNPGVDMKPVDIWVIAPAPLLFAPKQQGDGFMLRWRKDFCNLATQYKVYRKIDSSNYIRNECSTGLPASSGFTLIGSVNTSLNPNDTFFYDNNNGNGLSPLITYCYRIVAIYPPRRGNTVLTGKVSESYPSEEVCGTLIKSIPIITNVSVLNTSATNGKVWIKWLRPDTLDTTYYLPPYRFILQRKSDADGISANVDSISYSSYASFADSAFTDSMLNTSGNQLTYQILFTSNTSFGRQTVGRSPEASSLRLIIYSTDRTNIISWSYKVPWFNDTIFVYKKNASNLYSLLGSTTGNNYRDTGLVNNSNYCYLLQSSGSYSPKLYPKRLYNFSQEMCGTPIDTVRPCAPTLTVLPPCSSYVSYETILKWVPKNTCGNDVVKYRIYYKKLSSDPFILLDSVTNTIFEYVDKRYDLKTSIAGCYAVLGVDSFSNESFFTNTICIDNCPEYIIPNVFTPNSDNVNDTLHPFPYRFVEKIDLIIYNRWGSQVYNTTNMDINWTGKDISTGNDCSEGVYYYLCDVYERFLSGTKKRTLRGTIQIIR